MDGSRYEKVVMYVSKLNLLAYSCDELVNALLRRRRPLPHHGKNHRGGARRQQRLEGKQREREREKANQLKFLKIFVTVV